MQVLRLACKRKSLSTQLVLESLLAGQAIPDVSLALLLQLLLLPAVLLVLLLARPLLSQPRTHLVLELVEERPLVGLLRGPGVQRLAGVQGVDLRRVGEVRHGRRTLLLLHRRPALRARPAPTITAMVDSSSPGLLPAIGWVPVVWSLDSRSGWPRTETVLLDPDVADV